MKKAESGGSIWCLRIRLLFCRFGSRNDHLHLADNVRAVICVSEAQKQLRFAHPAKYLEPNPARQIHLNHRESSRHVAGWTQEQQPEQAAQLQKVRPSRKLGERNRTWYATSLNFSSFRRSRTFEIRSNSAKEMALLPFSSSTGTVGSASGAAPDRPASDCASVGPRARTRQARVYFFN